MTKRDRSPRPLTGTQRLAVLRSRRQQRLTRVGFAGVAATLAFLLTRVLISPDPAVLEEPPTDLLGTWVSDDPRYADRSFTIGVAEFHLQVGPTEVLLYPVREIRRVESENRIDYQITYVTPAGDAVHEMQVDSEGVARLKNPRDATWVRR